jgi:hypothetical protein
VTQSNKVRQSNKAQGKAARCDETSRHEAKEQGMTKHKSTKVQSETPWQNNIVRHKTKYQGITKQQGTKRNNKVRHQDTK